MDLKDKLKYYQDSVQSKPDNQKKNHLVRLADNLKAYVYKDNSLPLIKRESNFNFNQLQIDKSGIDSIKLPVLTKGDFLRNINVYELVFFDLETTGLSGGAGTYPFLIGIAFFDNYNFKVIQYFLPEYDRDIYAYLDIKKYIKDKSTLVSFNGKSYDYPLLKNRFILNRFEDIFKSFNHIDLLHLSRRVWKNSLENCSLGNIEQQIFKFSRLNDIDGYLIPHTYFDYLQSSNFDDIIKIVLHNEQDLVSLARLIVHLSQIENKAEIVSINKTELISLFDAAVRSNSLSKVKYYNDLLIKRNIKIPDKSILNYSLLLKRNLEWKECLNIWESLITSKEYGLFAMEELAKYYEHRKKNTKKALEYTNRATELINIIIELNNNHKNYTIKSDFEYRKERLIKKNTSEQ